MAESKMDRRKFKIIIDTREKKAWQFKATGVVSEILRTKLDTGDYSIEGLEDIICIERKASLLELYANVTIHNKRFYKEIARMRDIRFKYIIVEATLEEAMNPFSYKYLRTKAAKVRAQSTVIAHVIRLETMYDINVIWAGKHGRQIARQILERIHRYKINGELENY